MRKTDIQVPIPIARFVVGWLLAFNVLLIAMIVWGRWAD